MENSPIENWLIYLTFKKKLLRKFANKIGLQGICLVVTIASNVNVIFQDDKIRYDNTSQL